MYDRRHDWPAYDLTKSQKLTGVIRELNYKASPPYIKIAADKKAMTVILAPHPGWNFAA